MADAVNLRKYANDAQSLALLRARHISVLPIITCLSNDDATIKLNVGFGNYATAYQEGSMAQLTSLISMKRDPIRTPYPLRLSLPLLSPPNGCTPRIWVTQLHAHL